MNSERAILTLFSSVLIGFSASTSFFAHDQFLKNEKIQNEKLQRKNAHRKALIAAFMADEEYRMNPNRPPIYAFEDPLTKIQHEKRFGLN